MNYICMYICIFCDHAHNIGHVNGSVLIGHRASATKAIGRAEDLLAPEKPDLDKLSQLKLTLSEKLETLKSLDSEILDMVKEDDVAEETEQADGFKEGACVCYSSKNRSCLRSMPIVPSPTPVTSAPSTGLSSSSHGGSHSQNSPSSHLVVT